MSHYDLQYIDPQSEFLENAWYVAAQSTQVVDELVSIRMFGVNILFYRDTRERAGAWPEGRMTKPTVFIETETSGGE